MGRRQTDDQRETIIPHHYGVVGYKSRGHSQKVGVPLPKNRIPFFFHDLNLMMSMFWVTSFLYMPDGKSVSLFLHTFLYMHRLMSHKRVKVLFCLWHFSTEKCASLISMMKICRGAMIHRKYGSLRYVAGGSVHSPFLVISVRFTKKKISSKDKIKKKNSRETA